MKFAYLEISTWAGIAFGAIHFYGKLIFEDDEQDLKHILTTKEASQLREERPDLYDRRFLRAKSGDSFIGFWDRNEIVPVAILKYKELFPEADGLILGSPMIGDPQQIIHGAEKIAKKANALVKRVEAFGNSRWSAHEKEMRSICNQWDKLMKGK